MMNYYKVSFVKENTRIFFIDVFEFPDRKKLLEYFCNNYPVETIFHVKQVEEEEAKVLREKRRGELSGQVKNMMEVLKWNTAE